ncbi:hypothetical protein EDB59_4492 [Vibrio crassostreae]|uniref:hypothetical protein n=1 Tax=Vibrio crassostreae TaxID=246167 RepID=UPI000F4A2C4C|nr:MULTISPECIES: hypothetical protein [Vibrio]ROR57422.1 hypothetical protein EDB59_4492 [Vibrio crassostreae]UPR33187.1 hypothetical protein ISX50_08605 [Vibrio cyclitrophicus]
MAVYCVSYDLNKSGQDYKGLTDEIKAIGDWWHYLDSTWLVSTSSSASQISDKLRTKIDNNDQLLVIKVTGECAGWLPQKAWDWISQRT